MPALPETADSDLIPGKYEGAASHNNQQTYPAPYETLLDPWHAQALQLPGM